MKGRGAGFTPLLNELIDRWLPLLTSAEWKVLTVIARLTFGWQKSKARLTIDQLERRTGLRRATVLMAITGLLDWRLLRRVRVGRSFEYEIRPTGGVVQLQLIGAEKTTGGAQVPTKQRRKPRPRFTFELTAARERWVTDIVPAVAPYLALEVQKMLDWYNDPQNRRRHRARVISDRRYQKWMLDAAAHRIERQGGGQVVSIASPRSARNRGVLDAYDAKEG